MDLPPPPARRQAQVQVPEIEPEEVTIELARDDEPPAEVEVVDEGERVRAEAEGDVVTAVGLVVRGGPLVVRVVVVHLALEVRARTPPGGVQVGADMLRVSARADAGADDLAFVGVALI